mgnify:CR=1 FL=1
MIVGCPIGQTGRKGRNMKDVFIRDEEMARAIIARYEKCGVCSECWLQAEGFRCSYVYEKALAYINRKSC